MHRRILRLVIGVAAVAAMSQAAIPAYAATPYYLFEAAQAASLLTPDAPPPGANDWSCHPSAGHPRPVVLIHGTFANALSSWGRISAELKNNGYCVFALDYGGAAGNPVKATAHIPDSAAELASYVDSVLTATGAAKVDLVGYSQGGGVMPRWYLAFDGGAAKVGRLVGISPSNHGTTLDGLGLLANALGLDVSLLAGPAAQDQLVGSEVNQTLDAQGDTRPGVAYTTIVSRLDEVVTPYQNQYLTAGPGATVTNYTLQNFCPLDLSDHLHTPYDPAAVALTLNALDPAHPRTVSCL
ncbi:esterase/lipase family protein [Hamadaea tsunoensis]|uniref:esterase/lipase family protein n=1 Tax=Hamadaea tsunoensis TaxID=53368 RepID=UPI00042117A5|nr:alpha/beta fold hydrolase [Hamadaea tsunoensis]